MRRKRQGTRREAVKCRFVSCYVPVEMTRSGWLGLAGVPEATTYDWYDLFLDDFGKRDKLEVEREV